jgi:hypothetical protein
MYLFTPYSFHLSIYLGEKKTLTSTLLPLNNFLKKRKKNQVAPFQVPPSHNEYNINPGLSQQ